MNKFSTLYIVVALILGLVGVANANVLFEDDFTGGLSWVTSDNSVYINDDEYLYIGSDGGYDDWAEKEFSIDLAADAAIVIEQRVKLESGGLNYRLPDQTIVFEDSSEMSVTYLSAGDPPENYGWLFNGLWTGITEPEVPGAGWWTSATADYWTVTRIELTPTGGQLFMKPDDLEKEWYSEEFQFIASTNWSHSQITKIRFDQPWDSVNYVDYIKISIVPEPATLSLVGLGGALLLRRKRK